MNKDILHLLKENKPKRVSFPAKNVDVLEFLRKSRVKITNERKKIINVLGETKAPLSPADIFLRIRPALPKANLTTVYRNIEMLEGLGILKRLSFNRESFLYELITNRSHHHHVICKKCGKIEDLEHASEDFVNQVQKQTNFKIEDHNLEFFGLCSGCQKENYK